MIKKSLFILLVLLISVKSFSQTPAVVSRSSDVIVASDGGIIARNTMRAPVYSDTTAANAASFLLDSCGKFIFTYSDNSFWLRACSPKRWVKILKTGDATNIAPGYGIDTTVNSITGTITIKADTLEVSTPKATLDTAINVLIRGIVVVDTIQFVHSGNSVATYQNNKLIDSKLLYLSVESYPVGFVTRSNSIYMGFNPSTGTITLTNGRIYGDDMVYILYRTAAIFLVDGNGHPVIDSNGNYVIEN